MPHETPFFSPIDNNTEERDAVDYYIAVELEVLPSAVDEIDAVIGMLSHTKDVAMAQGQAMNSVAGHAADMELHLKHMVDYRAEDLLSSNVEVAFESAFGQGTGAKARVSVKPGVVISVEVVDGGEGYSDTNPPWIYFGPSTQGGRRASGHVTVTNGAITSLEIGQGGWGYVDPPEITIWSNVISGTVEPSLIAVLSDGAVTNVEVLDGGEDYVYAPLVHLTGSNGSGATASAKVVDGSVTEINVTYGGSGYTRHANWDYRDPIRYPNQLPTNPNDVALQEIPLAEFEDWQPVHSHTRAWPYRILDDPSDGDYWYRGVALPFDDRVPAGRVGTMCHGLSNYRDDWDAGFVSVYCMQKGEVIAVDHNHSTFDGVVVVHQIDGRTVRYSGMNMTGDVFMGPQPARDLKVGDTVNAGDKIGGIGRLNSGDHFPMLSIEMCENRCLFETPYFLSMDFDLVEANFLQPEKLWVEHRTENDSGIVSDLTFPPFDNNTPVRDVLEQWLIWQAESLANSEPPTTDIRIELDSLNVSVNEQIEEMRQLDEQVMAIRVAQTNMEGFRDENLPDHYIVFRYGSPFNPSSDSFYSYLGQEKNVVPESVYVVNMTHGGENYQTPPAVRFDSNTGGGASASAELVTGVTSIDIVNPGRHFTSAPDILFGGGGHDPNLSVPTHATAEISGGVHDIVLNHWGHGYTGTPTVSFDDASVTGSGAAATAHTAKGVYAIAVTDGGYDYTSAPTVELVGGGDEAAGAVVTAIVAGEVKEVDISDAGADYDSVPAVVFAGGGGSGAEGVATVANGFVIDVTVTSKGEGYTSPPDVIFSHGNAQATSIMDQVIWKVEIDAPGDGYTEAPTVNLIGGGGQGSYAVAMVSDVIDSITVDVSGSGYTTAPPITIVGLGQDAAATAEISGVIVAVIVDEPFRGYTEVPTVSVVGGGGQDAELQANISQLVRRVTIRSKGFGYETAPTVNFITVEGEEGSGATATALVSKVYRKADLYDIVPWIPGSYQGGFCHGIAWYVPQWEAHLGNPSYANDVFAILGGEIIYVDEDSRFGYMVVIHQDDQKIARYHRLTWLNPNLAAGTRIEQGAFMGQIGVNKIWGGDGVTDVSGFTPEPTFCLDICLGHALIDSPTRWDGDDITTVENDYVDPLKLFAEGSIGPNPAAL